MEKARYKFLIIIFNYYYYYYLGLLLLFLSKLGSIHGHEFFYGLEASCLFSVVFLYDANQGWLLCSTSIQKSPLPHQKLALIKVRNP